MSPEAVGRLVLVPALLLLAACAQPAGHGRPGLAAGVPTDRWLSDVPEKLAVVASADRGAVLSVICNSNNVATLLVAPDKELSGDTGYKPVTIILDDETSLVQDWSLPKAAMGSTLTIPPSCR